MINRKDLVVGKPSDEEDDREVHSAGYPFPEQEPRSTRLAISGRSWGDDYVIRVTRTQCSRLGRDPGGMYDQGTECCGPQGSQRRLHDLVRVGVR